MAQLSSRLFPEVYENLGIDTSELGCIMVDVDPIQISDIIKEDDLYVKPEDPSYLKGFVSELTPHVTLLFGLMQSGVANKKNVDLVLNGWLPTTITIDHVDFFYGEDNIVIVAKVVPDPNLMEGNARLRMLPHIDTFPDFTPHITLAYVKSTSNWQSYITALNDKYKGQQVQARTLNYGDA